MDLLNTAITLTITAAGILLIKKLFDRHITPRGHMFMWGLLLVVCLFSYGNSLMPESALSLRSLMPQISSEVTVETPETTPQNIPSQAGPQHTQLPPEADVQSADGQSAEPTMIRTTITARMPFTGQIIEREYYETRQENQARRGSWHLPYLLTVLAAWGLLAAAVIRQNRRIEALPDVDPQTEEGMRMLEILQEMKEKAEVTADIRLKTGAKTTVLARVRKPVICLEEGFCEEELRHVFAHELTHYKHGDLWLSELFAWGACMYWWNPVMWIAFRRFRHDQEVYCDYDAAQLAGDRRAYARLLVSAAGQNRFLIGTTSFLGGEKEVSRRVKFLAAFKKPKTWICTLATAALIVCGVGLALNPKEGGLAVQGLSSEEVSSMRLQYTMCKDGQWYLGDNWLYAEDVDLFLEHLKAAELAEKESEDAYYAQYQQLADRLGVNINEFDEEAIDRGTYDIWLEREGGGAHRIMYCPGVAGVKVEYPVLVSLGNGKDFYCKDAEFIAEIEALYAEMMDQLKVRQTGYVSPVPLTEETRVCPDTCTPQEAVQIYAEEYTRKKFVGTYKGAEEWGRVTEYTAIRPELVAVTFDGTALLGQYEYAMETEHMENFYPVGGLDWGLAEYSDKIYSADAFVLAKKDGYWHLANYGSDCWLDESLGLKYYAVPFEETEFQVEAHVYSDKERIYDNGIIYKSADEKFTDLNYARVYGSGTYTFKDGDFIVTGGENSNWTYENAYFTANHYPDGGDVYVSGTTDPYDGVAVTIDAPYTEYRIHSDSTADHDYRIYEIWRKGDEGECDYREYWLGYFQDQCRHIFNLGHVFEQTASYKITESLNLVERLHYSYSNGDAESFTLQDEETGKKIMMYTGDYTDFVGAVDENHLVFYSHGRNLISESYNKFPYLLHLVRNDRTSDVFEQYREAICFPLDEVTVNGKQADCHLDDMQFTADGIELAVTPDPANPMDFYAAYTDMVWTRVSHDVQQKALRLTTRSITSVNEEMLNKLQVPEDHPYIEGFAVERKEGGAEILLYLKDAARGYYAESDAASNPDRPVLKLRLTSEEGVRY